MDRVRDGGGGGAGGVESIFVFTTGTSQTRQASVFFGYRDADWFAEGGSARQCLCAGDTRLEQSLARREPRGLGHTCLNRSTVL